VKAYCKEDVIMDTGEIAFTEGETYRIYESTYKDGWDVFNCIKAKNNQSKRHIIMSGKLGHAFFEKHFRLTVEE
jgi:hypothetical protein